MEHTYQHYETLEPYIIHFNYVRGDKVELMKHGEWYFSFYYLIRTIWDDS